MSSCETFANAGSCAGTEMIIYWILNFVAFLLLPITGIVALAEYAHNWYDWLSTYYYSTFYEPLTTDDVMMYILVGILIILSLYALAIISLKGIVIKDGVLYDAIFSQWGRFIFIPILITCGMFYIGNAHGENRQASLIVGLIFAIFGAGGFMFIYYTLPSPGESWMLFVYKKCLISCLIVFNLFFFFYDICHIVRQNSPKDGEVCSYVFMVIFGLIIGVGIWVLVEVVSGMFGWLLYVGFVAYSSQGGDNRKVLRRTGDLIISIIFMIGLLAEIIVLCVIKKKEVIH